MEFKDETLVCADCGQEFTFSAGEQEFYREKGLSNAPKRCPDCRRAKKQQRQRGGGGGGYGRGRR
ncbi:MAG: zinc-ribbon domain-containing protein [Candidatus Marinimicrobia bacterium]|nr:zinc-ribbon domain-containing protein [Candidatus Neomarinimicrobiota bacterium]